MKLVNGASTSLFVLMLAAACTPPGETRDQGVSGAATKTFSAIGADETISLTGTEPFWGGEINGTRLVYKTPENADGAVVAVERFAGNNGLAYSGELDGKPLDLTVTPGECSDGMSDRTYPFVATLKLGEETRHGCAWTEATPFSGPEAP